MREVCSILTLPAVQKLVKSLSQPHSLNPFLSSPTGRKETNNIFLLYSARFEFKIIGLAAREASVTDRLFSAILFSFSQLWPETHQTVYGLGVHDSMMQQLLSNNLCHRRLSTLGWHLVRTQYASLHIAL